MICISIGRGRHKMLLAEYAHSARLGADLTELRIDYVLRNVDLKRLLKERHTPAIVTCRRPEDGGKWRGSESDRVVLLRSAIVAGTDYIDLEEDIAGDVPRYGDTKRIVSYHNLRETPDNIEDIHASMLGKDPDIIKIATMANAPSDNKRVLNLIKNSPVPTVAFCMGDLGMISRIICLKFGAPFTFAALSSERSLAPGQFSFTKLKELYGVKRINSETEFLGVIADPVGHSLSPTLHNQLLRKDDVNKVYLPIRVPREHLDDFMDCFTEMDITGLSVTIPHKETVLRFANRLDEDVAGIRAANTIVCKKQAIAAYNTDCRAAMLSLAHAEDALDEKKPFAGKKALVLGSGGVAKALVYGLTIGGATVMLTGRNTRVAEQMSIDYRCKFVDWTARHDVPTDYIINCTPVGMHPDLNSTPYDTDRLKPEYLVFDTVYNPQRTMLIKGAMEKECRIITGVDMFVRQAALQYKLFTGTDPSVSEMRKIFVEAINPAKYKKGKSSSKDKTKESPKLSSKDRLEAISEKKKSRSKSKTRKDDSKKSSSKSKSSRSSKSRKIKDSSD